MTGRGAAPVALLTVLLAVATTGCDDGMTPQPPIAVDSPTATTTGTTGPAGDPTPTEEPGPRSFRLVMGGDLLWHNTVWASAAEDAAGTGERYDWDPMFATLKPTIEDADLAICHAEVPFAAPGEQPASYPVFAAPRSIAPWTASMGWDACTTASNHSWDRGFEGVVTTADLLEAHGIPHVGTFRTPRERERPVILTTGDGIEVGIVAGTFSLNGFVPAPEEEFAVSMWDADNLLAQARAAREAGADVVVVHVHWGDEYVHEPSPEQLALAEQLTASPDVDLVLGEHAHVVQPITRVNGKWVVYGMGNQIAQNESTRVATYEGITVDFELTERPGAGFRVTRAAYVPTQWNHYSPGHPIRIAPASGERLASIRSAVNLLGGNRGLVED
jgi:hypothetical protein